MGVRKRVQGPRGVAVEGCSAVAGQPFMLFSGRPLLQDITGEASGPAGQTLLRWCMIRLEGLLASLNSHEPGYYHWLRRRSGLGMPSLGVEMRNPGLVKEQDFRIGSTCCQKKKEGRGK